MEGDQVLLQKAEFDYAPGGGNRCLISILGRDSQAVLTVTVFHHVVGVGVCVWEVVSAPALPAYWQGVLARVRRLVFKGFTYTPGSFCMCVDMCIYT